MTDIGMTPSYIFDIDVFHKRISDIEDAFPGVPLTYSIKANPFLVPYIPSGISHLEVCSPGELAICRELRVNPEKIIYSGVVKGEADIREALAYGVGIVTAESMGQYELIRGIASHMSTAIRLLPRLSSGNQFGMSVGDLCQVIKDAADDRLISIEGIHYYSGTAKKIRQVEEDIQKLRSAIASVEEKTGYKCTMLEYGPGLATECFAETEAECEAKDMELLRVAAPLIKELGSDVSLGIEMGRFMAATCGTYETTVVDMKETDGTNHVLIDGGTHQLKYHGPNAAMKVPLIEHAGMGDECEYMICGSLCTSADILVRNVRLKQVGIGDVLRFKRAGAYSVTEAPVLFLSRIMPAIYIRSRALGKVLVRDPIDAYKFNIWNVSN